MSRVLIVDDDSFLCDLMQSILEKQGMTSEVSLTLSQGLALANEGEYDLVFLDVLLPDGDGLEKLNEFLSAPHAPTVVVMTGAGDPESAERALLHGAWDYIQKPITVQDVKSTVTNALAYREKHLQLAEANQDSLSPIIGNSHKIQACLSMVLKASQTNSNCLIVGETGTGKELFARAIHDSSPRAGHHFVVVDCTNIPATLAESLLFGHSKGSFTGAGDSKDGLFKQADKGTLFLDEIGDLPMSIQKSLLRVLQEKRFRPIGYKTEVSSDFKLIAATNRDLEEMVKAGAFRSDLYYRLSSVILTLPPLRERGDDVELLVRHFANKFIKDEGLPPKEFTPSVMKALTSYPWPGNVRELINAVITSITNAMDHGTLELYHLPVNIRIHLKKSSLHNGLNNYVTDVCQEEPELEPEPEPTPEPPRDPVRMQGTASPIPSFKDARRKVVDAFEQEYFSELVVHARGDLGKACAFSGLSRARIYQLLRKHELNLH